eukprot:jgi/Mesen1/9278/ME000060S08719
MGTGVKRGMYRHSLSTTPPDLTASTMDATSSGVQYPYLHDPNPSPLKAHSLQSVANVIELTEELLTSARQAELSSSGAPPQVQAQQEEEEEAHPGRLGVGTSVEAMYSADSQWYAATVKGVTAGGYIVVYNDWGNEEEVDASSVRARMDQGGSEKPEEGEGASAAAAAAQGEGEQAEGAAEGGGAAVSAEAEAEAGRLALKRKIAQAASADLTPKNLPAKLKVNPDDPEDVKIAKRKKIHAFKSKQRMEMMELTQDKRQNSWQQKKESIFKSPEDLKGKVGVTGSGHGMTDFQRREKFLNLKVGSDDVDE